MKNSKRRVCIAITLSAILLLLIYEILGMLRLGAEDLVSDPSVGKSLGMIITRALGSVVFITILVYLGYRVKDPVKGLGGAVLFSLPAFAVAINNLPIYPLVTDLAEVTAPPWRILLLALECLLVGLFEETCFRGVIFLGFLEKRRRTKRGQLIAILLSAAVFGAVHLLNLFLGASPVAVLMQIGYSFLIGAMCSVVLIKTANIWLCAFLHGLFNFCGAVVPTCGSGRIWEPFTITLTVLIALAATAYFTVAFFRADCSECDRLYPECD